MKWSDFNKFRAKIVAALAEHPEWKKTKRRPYDLAPTVIPNSREAKAYWRIRNGTKGICRKQANFDEEAALRLGSAYCPGGDFEMDESDARNVEKWMREFEQIDGTHGN